MGNTQNNWKIGLILSLVTVLFWSTLPVSLKISMSAMDAWTLTWLRFLFAALVTSVLLLLKKRYHQFLTLNSKEWLWLIVAATMLVANYLLFLYGLEMTSPANAQVFIQMAPLLMTLGGVLIFKESFSKIQFFGASLIVVGMAFFFKDQLTQILNSDFSLGFAVMFAAALTWAIYALIQKKLASKLSSQTILLFIYLFASLSLLGGIDTVQFQHVSNTQWWAVAYACVNTVGAYTAFAEALNYWQASRVGMVLAMTPVFTLLFINVFAGIFPDLLDHETISLIGYLGIGFIVSGSMLASLKK
ncbi:DMT family transporter [Marinicella rhabdoformis]|uniref:DMT family transporter n=1 Tax=Marinicella rhabdoformis TaxID=2580566 RepID=UPI0012AED39B|nr:DMT family transporter [Marinicella rhabdoformis]